MKIEEEAGGEWSSLRRSSLWTNCTRTLRHHFTWAAKVVSVTAREAVHATPAPWLMQIKASAGATALPLGRLGSSWIFLLRFGRICGKHIFFFRFQTCQIINLFQICSCASILDSSAFINQQQASQQGGGGVCVFREDLASLETLWWWLTGSNLAGSSCRVHRP